MELYAAFTLGLFGSLHCVGMCGPLMMAAGKGRGWAAAGAYQSGRILVYILLGAALGAFGLGMKLWNVQSQITLVCGGLLVVAALLRLDPGGYLQRLPALARFQLALRARMAGYLRGGGLRAQFALGGCNGLLPCGLVYLAVIGAANAEGPLAGSLFMLAFGLGTLPLLLITLAAGRRLFAVRALPLAKLTSVLLLVAGCLLLYRGFVSYVPDEFYAFQDRFFPPMCH